MMSMRDENEGARWDLGSLPDAIAPAVHSF